MGMAFSFFLRIHCGAVGLDLACCPQATELGTMDQSHPGVDRYPGRVLGQRGAPPASQSRLGCLLVRRICRTPSLCDATFPRRRPRVVFPLAQGAK
jgi:hypothetical protein